MDFSATYKILVLGDSNVGKTVIINYKLNEKIFIYFIYIFSALYIDIVMKDITIHTFLQ